MVKGIALAAILLLCNLQATQFHYDDIEQVEKEVPDDTFVVSPMDIICEGDDIFIMLEDTLYPVRSLERSGSSWLAKVNPYNSFCPAGHNVCGFCHLCHLQICSFYVPPCSRGK